MENWQEGVLVGDVLVHTGDNLCGKHVFWEGIPGHGYREYLYRGKMGVGGPQEWCLRFWPEKPVKDNVIHHSRGQWGRGGAEREEYLLLWSRAEYVELSRGSWPLESESQNMSLEPLRLIAKGSLSHLGMSRSNVGIDWPFSLPHSLYCSLFRAVSGRYRAVSGRYRTGNLTHPPRYARSLGLC